MRLGARTRLRWLRNRLVDPGARAAILIYHRVADDPSDPYGNCIRPENFDEHLDALGRIARPDSLGDMMTRYLREGRIRDGTVCVTFDDGYRDNLEVALPLLERHEIPATLFVTTGPGGRSQEYWWDRLSAAVLCADDPDRPLELSVAGALMEGVTEPPDLIRRLHRAILPLPSSERERLVDQVVSWSGGVDAPIRDSHRTLTPDELAVLDRHPLIQVESHTVHHAPLSLRPSAEQLEELRESRDTLSEWIDRPVQGLAYPHGRADHDTAVLAREAGYRWAVGSEQRAFRAGADPWLLPRVPIADSGAGSYRRRVSWILH